MNLADDEIRIKVAEAMGLFRIKPLKRTTRKGKDDTNGVRLWYCSEHHGGAATYDEIPNYPLDLNACAEFEATLTDEEQAEYWKNLVTLCNEAAREQNNFRLIGIFYQITAKPKMRCIAFLKTKGLIP